MRLRIVLLALLLILLFLPGCHIFSRSKHTISPPVTEMERTTNETIPSKKAAVIWEIEIIPPGPDVFPSEDWQEVRP